LRGRSNVLAWRLPHQVTPTLATPLNYIDFISCTQQLAIMADNAHVVLQA